LTLAFAGSVGASNHVTFSDPAGDNEVAPGNANAYASDVRVVDITSADNGDVRIAVTLVDGPARLVNGDQLDVYINIDRNQSTGQSGFDIDLVAVGQSSGQPTFFLCRLSTPVSCEAGVAGFGHDTPTATSTHVVDFNLSTGIPAFDFFVRATYPNGSASLKDDAPNSGVFTYPVKADPDGDGVHGTSDECPTTRATGQNDRNGNGCPGPFQRIRAREPHFRAVPFSSYLQLSGLRFTGLPTGAQVEIAARSRRERVTANRFGVAPSRLLAGALPYRMVITVRITKAAYIGAYIKLATDRRQGLRLVQKRCIPAVGSQAPVACSGKLTGR
jgi:hypothetical protein